MYAHIVKESICICLILHVLNIDVCTVMLIIPNSDYETSVVILHEGTTNLKGGFWSKEGKHYLNLYQSAKEIFRSAVIIFSFNLPSWDSEDLHQQSLYFNSSLAKLSCQWIDCQIFKFDFANDLFSVDGWHLNFQKHLKLQQIFTL